jgi:hypothetical protein
MLTEKPEALGVRRYADYQGNENLWPLTTLLRRYFVPIQRTPPWSEDAFYRDVSKSKARQAIRQQLSALKREIPPQLPEGPNYIDCIRERVPEMVKTQSDHTVTTRRGAWGR